MVSPEPKQFKTDDAAYALIDKLLESLRNAGPEELITHLIIQTKTYEIAPIGPVLKAINVIRGLIEDQGANPDELMKKREEETE